MFYVLLDWSNCPFFASRSLHAQRSPYLLLGPASDSVGLRQDSLPVVEIYALRQQLVANPSRWVPREVVASQAASVADLLQSGHGVFIKTYGLGSLATTSLRGGSAAHTATFWNGLPLDNPMLGLLDMSLLSPSFFSSLRLQPGGQSAGWGSGAVAAVLLLENDAACLPLAEASLALGSFGQQTAQFSHSLRSSPLGGDGAYWQWNSRLYWHQAQNDFTFRLRDDLPLQQQHNAANARLATMQELYFHSNATTHYALRYWGQNSRQEIPPTTVQNRSEAVQEDHIFRLALARNKVGDKQSSRTNLGYFREQIDYEDPLASVYSLGFFDRLVLDQETHTYLSPKSRFTYGLAAQWVKARIDAYEQPATQWRLDPYVAYQYSQGRWRGEIHWRQASVDGRLLPPVPALSWAYLGKQFGLRSSVNRNYRLPTLNDLYWQNGGNPDLNPEAGWSKEVQASYQLATPLWIFRYELTGHQRRLRNWIQWAPGEGSTLWEASNLTRVRSRGVEQRLMLSRDLAVSSLKPQRLTLSLSHDYVESTNEIAITIPRIEAGQQLWYVPFHQASARLAWEGSKGSIAYQQQWTGSVRSQNAGALAGYSLGQLYGEYKGACQGLEWQFFGRLENVWNVRYRIIERRVMPARMYRLGWLLSLVK